MGSSGHGAPLRDHPELGIGQGRPPVPLIWAVVRLKIEAESFICLDS